LGYCHLPLALCCGKFALNAAICLGENLRSGKFIASPLVKRQKRPILSRMIDLLEANPHAHFERSLALELRRRANSVGLSIAALTAQAGSTAGPFRDGLSARPASGWVATWRCFASCSTLKKYSIGRHKKRPIAMTGPDLSPRLAPRQQQFGEALFARNFVSRQALHKSHLF
jgi:hypothetical protein